MKKILIIALLLKGSLSFSQKVAETEEVRIVNEFLTAVVTKDHDTKLRLLDKDLVWDQPGKNALSGLKNNNLEVFEMSKKMSQISHGTLKLTNFKILGVNGNTVACQLHFTAVRPGGATLDVDNVDIYTVKNGKIIKTQVFSADVEQEDYFWGK